MESGIFLLVNIDWIYNVEIFHTNLKWVLFEGATLKRVNRAIHINGNGFACVC
jgi:hypothetical protein